MSLCGTKLLEGREFQEAYDTAKLERRLRSWLPAAAGAGAPNLDRENDGLGAIFSIFVPTSETGGLLSVMQLGSICAVLGFRPTPMLLTTLKQDFAKSANGKAFSFVEFRDLFRTIRRIRTRQVVVPKFDEATLAELRGLFDRADSDADGKLTPSELGVAVEWAGTETTREEVAKICAQIGTDDNVVSFEEFTALVSALSAAAEPSATQQEQAAHESAAERLLKDALRSKHECAKESERARRSGANAALTCFRERGDSVQFDKLSSANCRNHCAEIAFSATLVAAGSVSDAEHARSVVFVEVQKLLDAELIVACRKHRKLDVEAALRQGSSCDACEQEAPHRTALCCACDGGNEVECVSLMLAAGADATLCDDDGTTALMLASRGAATSENFALMTSLVEKGCNVNAAARDGSTALHGAVTFGRSAATRLLIKAGANVDALTSDHVSPLMRAARTGQARCVELLLQKGADQTLANRAGKTAAQIASRYDHSTVVDQFKMHAIEVANKLGGIDTAKGKLRASTKGAPSQRNLVFKAGEAPPGAAVVKPTQPITPKKTRVSMSSREVRALRAARTPSGRTMDAGKQTSASSTRVL